jgi:hypothetical protein
MHLRFDPLELLERLAVLTPRPRVNLILYYGVLAPPGGLRPPRCGGRLRLVALIEQASVVHRILRHLGLPREVPERHGRRPGDSRHSRINPETLLNSMPPGEGVASREERCRRAAVVLFPNDDFPWVFPPPWR